MADHSIDFAVPEDLKSAAQSRAEREGLLWTDWVARAVTRELARAEGHEYGYPLLLGIEPRTLMPLVREQQLLGAMLDETTGYWRFDNALRLIEGRSFGIHGLSFFLSKIDQGALLLSAAFTEAKKEFVPRHPRGRVKRSHHWIDRLVIDCRERSDEVRQALHVEWDPTGRAAELAVDAFKTLSELTQTSLELQRLCQTDRPRAFAELARHLELATLQFELTAQLVAEVEASEPTQWPEPDRHGDIQSDLLQRAGGGLSLTEAAKRLNLSRQGLHKRAKAASALAVMYGRELTFPLAQWTVEGKALTPIAGLPEILKLFEAAGAWSALQFLIEHDPNIGTSPRLALIDGRLDDVLNAAEAYLGLEEDD